MRYTLIFLFLALFTNYILGQATKETSHILLGTNYGLKRIKVDSFIIDTAYRITVEEVTGTLNNNEGRLLLYTNQSVIKDSNHNIVNNGLVFQSNNSTAQGAFFYQHPKRPYIDFFTNMGGTSNVKGGGVYHHYLEYTDDQKT